MFGGSSVQNISEYKGAHVATTHLDPIIQKLLHPVQLNGQVYLTSWIDKPTVEDDLPANVVRD